MAITDLTGTKWLFNANITDTGIRGQSFSLTGTIEASGYSMHYTYFASELAYQNYVYFRTRDSNIFPCFQYYTTNGWEYCSDASTRHTVSPPIITIEGGLVTSEILIAWFQANATQVFEGGSISVGNSSIAKSFVGTSEVLNMILNGSTIYEKQTPIPQLDAPTNVSVAGTEASFSPVENAESYEFFVDGTSIGTYTEPSGFTVVLSNNEGINNVYDGVDDTGVLLGTDDGTYVVSSGHITIKAQNTIFSVGTTSGGVFYNDSLSNSDIAVYDVDGDGSISDGWFKCFVEGTKITLADGSTKNVEDITYEDDLLVWDFYEGKFSTAKPMWIAPEHTANYYYRVEIEGGIVLKLVGSNGKSHRLYDYEGKQFSYPQDMGRNHTIDQNYKGLHIENIERIDETVKYYNIITETHYNLYAEGILTSCRLSNRYGIAQPFSRTCSQMKYDTNDVRMTEEEVQAYIDALEGVR